MSVADDVDELVRLLVAGGVRATSDPRRVDPPCALVVPEGGEFDTLCIGDANTDWVIHVLAPPPSASDSMRTLWRLVAGCLQVIPRIESVRASSYATGGEPWPSYELRFRTETSWL